MLGTGSHALLLLVDLRTDWGVVSHHRWTSGGLLFAFQDLWRVAESKSACFVLIDWTLLHERALMGKFLLFSAWFLGFTFKFFVKLIEEGWVVVRRADIVLNYASSFLYQEVLITKVQLFAIDSWSWNVIYGVPKRSFFKILIFILTIHCNFSDFKHLRVFLLQGIYQSLPLIRFKINTISFFLYLLHAFRCGL